MQLCRHYCPVLSYFRAQLFREFKRHMAQFLRRDCFRAANFPGLRLYLTFKSFAEVVSCLLGTKDHTR